MESDPTSAETLLRKWGEWGQRRDEEEDAGQRLDREGNLISNLCTLSELFISAPFSQVCVLGLTGSVSHCQAQHNPSSPGSVTKVTHSQLKMHFHNEQVEKSFHTWTKRLEGFLQHTVSFGTTFLTISDMQGSKNRGIS